MNQREIQVLLIEDNPGDVRLVQRMLAAGTGLVLDSRPTLSAGLERLQTEGIDAVLLDLLLPDSTGVDTYRRVQRAAPGIAIVVLSGLDDSALALQAVHEGAQDFLVKGHVDSTQLARALRHAVERKRTQNEANEEKFRVLAESTKDAIISADARCEIVFLNQEAERTFGYSRADVHRRPLVMLISERFRKRYQEGLEAYLLTGRSELVGNTVEVVGCKRDGSEFPMELSLATWESGSGVLFTGVVRDISERKRTEEELRELSGRLLLSQEQERRRLAREFHDGTSQILASMQLQIGLLQDLVPRESVAAQESLSELINLAGRCGTEIRTLTYVLHPPLFEEGGLGPALRAYARGFGDRSGIAVTVDVPEDWPDPGSEIETALFRVTQEALANIHRHSGSKMAHIRAALVQGQMLIEIRDQGRGIPNEVLRSPAKLGVGIRGMAERIRLLGGSLSIKSDERGTIVRAEIPSQAPASAPA